MRGPLACGEMGAEGADDVSFAPLPGRLTVDAGAPSAEIRLDGRLVGRGQYAQEVDPGRHRVEIRAPDRVLERSFVVVRPGQSQQLTVALRLVDAPGSIFERSWFWGGAAVVSAAVVVGIVLLQPASMEPYYNGSLGFTVEALSGAGPGGLR